MGKGLSLHTKRKRKSVVNFFQYIKMDPSQIDFTHPKLNLERQSHVAHKKVIIEHLTKILNDVVKKYDFGSIHDTMMFIIKNITDINEKTIPATAQHIPKMNGFDLNSAEDSHIVDLLQKYLRELHKLLMQLVLL